MWKTVWRALLAKNPEAVAITKVKGHATEDMVREGAVREEDRHGNEQSDQAADWGAMNVQEGLPVAPRYLHKRHREYCSLMRRIHTMIVKVLSAVQERRLEEEKKQALEGHDPNIVDVPCQLAATRR